jgi:hypothetical protein
MSSPVSICEESDDINLIQAMEFVDQENQL